jgi:glutamine synthetase
MFQLKDLLKEITTNYKWQVFIGLELEFYLLDATEKKLEPFFKNFQAKFPMCLVEEEKGTNQFEIKINHTNNIYQLITDTKRIKEYIIVESQTFGMTASFASKPFKDEPGSSLHVNISLYDQENNIYAKNGEIESDYLLYSVGGLMLHMLSHLKIFLPTLDDFARITPKQNSPTTVSWGANNRTVAIRIPTTNPLNRRIEHRVPSSNADPEKVIEAILFAIIDGIKNKVMPPSKIYGDASISTYELPPLTLP